METIQVDPSTTPLTEQFEQENPNPPNKSHNKRKRYEKTIFIFLYFARCKRIHTHTNYSINNHLFPLKMIIRLINYQQK